MENEEKKELQTEASKVVRPRKRLKSTGFNTEKPIVEEKKVEAAPAAEPTSAPVPRPEPKPAPAPAPAPRPVVKPVVAKPTVTPSTRKPRVSRPLKNNPNSGTQRGIRNRG